MGAKMNPEIKGYLIEEYDSLGNLVWYGLSLGKIDHLSWLSDLPSKKHNLVISPLIVYKEGIIKADGVKKYDSSKFVVGL